MGQRLAGGGRQRPKLVEQQHEARDLWPRERLAHERPQARPIAHTAPVRGERQRLGDLLGKEAEGALARRALNLREIDPADAGGGAQLRLQAQQQAGLAVLPPAIDHDVGRDLALAQLRQARQLNLPPAKQWIVRSKRCRCEASHDNDVQAQRTSLARTPLESD